MRRSHPLCLKDLRFLILSLFFSSCSFTESYIISYSNSFKLDTIQAGASLPVVPTEILKINTTTTHLTAEGSFEKITEAKLFSDSSCSTEVTTATTIATNSMGFDLNSLTPSGKNYFYLWVKSSNKSVCLSDPLVVETKTTLTSVQFSVDSFKMKNADGNPIVVTTVPQSGESIQIFSGSNCTGTLLNTMTSGSCSAGLCRATLNLTSGSKNTISIRHLDDYGNSICQTNPTSNDYDTWKPITQIVTAGQSLAAIRNDGSVTTWGISMTSVADKLDGTIAVTQIFPMGGGFGFLRADGSLITIGQDSSAVAAQLDGTIDVVDVKQTAFYGIAALRADGSVVTWGSSSYGGDSTSVASAIDGTIDVTAITSSYAAFAALRSDGSVIVWGDTNYGADASSVASSINGDIDVVQIYSQPTAFAARRTDGSVVTWGDDSYTGSSMNGVIGVTQIYSNKKTVSNWGLAFAALRTDGAVITWGPGTGGNFTDYFPYRP